MPLCRCQGSSGTFSWAHCFTFHVYLKAWTMCVDTGYLLGSYFNQRTDEMPPFPATMGVVIYVIIHDLIILLVAISFILPAQVFCIWESFHFIGMVVFFMYYSKGFEHFPESTVEMANNKEDDELRADNEYVTFDIVMVCLTFQVVMIMVISYTCFRKCIRREEAEAPMQIQLPFNHIGALQGPEPQQQQQQPVELIEMAVIGPNEE